MTIHAHTKTQALLLVVLPLLLLFYSQCSTSHSMAYDDDPHTSDAPMPTPEPGKCYAKCLMPDVYREVSQTFPVYTGDESDTDINIEYVRIEQKPASKTWVQKRADNCRSADPDDCLVWCLEDVPADILEIAVLQDTTQSDAYEWRTITYQVLERAGGFTEWQPILCADRVTQSVIRQVQQQLTDTGFYDGRHTERFDSKTKAALTAFQRARGLPVGQLDLKTMEVLGVVW